VVTDVFDSSKLSLPGNGGLGLLQSRPRGRGLTMSTPEERFIGKGDVDIFNTTEAKVEGTRELSLSLIHSNLIVKHIGS
jgi:hypothetical protein